MDIASHMHFTSFIPCPLTFKYRTLSTHLLLNTLAIGLRRVLPPFRASFLEHFQSFRTATEGGSYEAKFVHPLLPFLPLYNVTFHRTFSKYFKRYNLLAIRIDLKQNAHKRMCECHLFPSLSPTVHFNSRHFTFAKVALSIIIFCVGPAGTSLT